MTLQIIVAGGVKINDASNAMFLSEMNFVMVWLDEYSFDQKD